MATNVKIVGTDLRQSTLKVSPNEYLQNILAKACNKWNLSPDKHMFKHKEKELDLSKTFRNAGLVPGAKLELIVRSRSPAALSIALQLPEQEANKFGNNRATVKLPSDTTLWKVLRHFESETFKGKNINITGRGVSQTISSGSGQVYYETPVLVVERRTFSTFIEYQKTLSQLGYNSGNVLIRLSFQKTELSWAAAMESISQYFKEVEEQEQKPSVSKEESKAEDTDAKEVSGSVPVPPQIDGSSTEVTTELTPAHSGPQEIAAEPNKMIMDSSLPSDPLAPVSIFSAPSSSTPAASRTTDPESAFEPRIEHAQLHQKRLQTEGQNKRLKSDKQLEEEAAAKATKQASIKNIDIRVNFPDNSKVNWKFEANVAGGTLYKVVRLVMVAETAPFKLVLPVTGVLIRDDASNLIRTYDIGGRTAVNFVWDDAAGNDVRKQPFLKPEFAQMAKEIVVPEIPEGPEEDEPGPSSAPQKPAEPKKEGGGLNKMPKWMKLSGKK